MKGSGAPNEIPTYGYVKPCVKWFPIEEDPLTDPFRIARGLEGYAHRARSRAPSSKETWPSLTWPRPPPGARGLARALGSRSTAHPGPALGSCLANDASQGPGARRQAPSHQCSGAPSRHSLGMALPTAPLKGSCPGHDTRRQSFPLASRGSGASGPTRRPLEPTSFTTKKTPEGSYSGAPWTVAVSCS